MKLLRIALLLCFSIAMTQISYAQYSKSGNIETKESAAKKKKSSSSSLKRKAHNTAKSYCDRILVEVYHQLDEFYADRFHKEMSKEEYEELAKAIAERKKEMLEECIQSRMEEAGY